MSTVLVSLATLADQVLLQLPGCPYALAMDALRLAARNLCRKTGCWQEELELTTEAGVLSYALELPEGATIEAVARFATADGEPFAPAAYSIGFEPPATIAFRSDPGVGSYLVTVICVPSGTEIPGWLVTAEEETLRYGALACRQHDAGKPWSSQDWPVEQMLHDEAVRRLAARVLGGFAGRYDTALQGVRVL